MCECVRVCVCVCVCEGREGGALQGLTDPGFRKGRVAQNILVHKLCLVTHPLL